MSAFLFRILFSAALAIGSLRTGTSIAEEPLVAPAPRFDAILPKTMLKDVEARPKKLQMREEENEAYYRLLWHLGFIPPEEMKTAEIEFRRDRIEKYEARMHAKILKDFEQDEKTRQALFERLEEKIKEFQADPLCYELVKDAFAFPEACQGKPVSFRGHARKAISHPAGENNYGIETLYEIWLFEEDAKGFPIVIVCTELPENFPLNFPETQPLDGVSVRGYFFKLFAYEGREDFHAVPLILAKSVEWNPPVVVAPEFPPWAYVAIVILGLFVLYLILFRSGKGRRDLRQTRERIATAADNPFATHSSSTESDSNS
ncbi:MAG TPA: hypothetical protein VMM56_16150 [Planctomycetaceae bacterium]|nr:hypothetical protein [Planctomycetaceae bacterium]